MKTKNLLLVSLLALLLTGCMAYKGVYNVGLSAVERPENAKERYGESKIINFQDAGTTKYSYEDELIKIVWLPLSTEFSFTLENKSDHSIQIVWDEAAYENGSTGRIMHSGVKYIDRNNPQPPTVVIKKAKIDDIILPTDNVYYISGQYGGWNTKPLFPNSANSQEELNSLTQNYINKTVGILLPLKIEDTVNEYIFRFKVDGFKSNQ
jgi:hypothetical protein